MPIYRKWWFWLIAIIVFLSFMGMFTDAPDEEITEPEAAEEAVEEDTIKEEAVEEGETKNVLTDEKKDRIATWVESATLN